MKYLRAILIAIAFAAVSISFGVATATDNMGADSGAAACQRCGDGYCARSCENERTCPQDCAPQTK
jgi:hypothetical protein